MPVSHVIRKQTHQTALEDGRDLPDSQPQETTPAAWYVHIDQSYQGAREFLHDNLPSAEEAERLQKTRWGMYVGNRSLSLPPSLPPSRLNLPPPPHQASSTSGAPSSPSAAKT